jgi:hypothetical protein
VSETIDSSGNESSQMITVAELRRPPSCTWIVASSAKPTAVNTNQCSA